MQLDKIIAKSNNDELRYNLLVYEIYNAMETAHNAISHGERDRLCKETSKKYANIST